MNYFDISFRDCVNKWATNGYDDCEYLQLFINLNIFSNCYYPNKASGRSRV